jgi:hypothetical protein
MNTNIGCEWIRLTTGRRTGGSKNMRPAMMPGSGNEGELS